MIYVEVKPGWFVRKDAIESITELTYNDIMIRTLSGIECHLTAKEAKPVLEELCFNEK